MQRNPWFTLVVGIIAGLVLGYLLAERQTIPPAKAMVRQPGAGPEGGDGAS